MITRIEKITPHLWFDNQAEEAAKLYTGIFINSGIDRISHYTSAGQEVHGQKPGSVMTVEFNLDGQKFLALNAGPHFKFNEAVSFVVNCDAQEEVEYYWRRLSEGGDPNAQQCGWLKDKYGLSWQIVPTILPKLISDEDEKKAAQVMTALLRMKKLNIPELETAAR